MSRRATLIGIAWLAAVAVAAFGGWRIAIGWRPSPVRYPLQGIDLGIDPPTTDWGSMRAGGADFAYIVATAGPRRRDQSFELNWQGVADAGLRRGAVHLYSLCAGGAAQADAFNTVVPASADALPAAADVSFRDDCAERPDAEALAREVARFAAMVEAHTGKPILLRIAPAVEERYALSAKIDRPVWETRNFLAPNYAVRPWRLWRATDLRRVAGVDGPVNWDVVAP